MILKPEKNLTLISFSHNILTCWINTDIKDEKAFVRDHTDPTSQLQASIRWKD